MGSRLEQIPEKLLTRLWRERASREASLRAGDGRRFRVIYPGRVGTGAGPDFRDAVLEEEGVGLVRGDVEVHVRRSDWESHGHGTDPRYNGVVLHVVSDTDTTATTLRSGQRVPVVSLDPLLRRPSRREAAWDPWSLLRPYGYQPPGNSEESVSTLDRAGDARLLEMSAAFAALLAEQEPDQALYSSLMEALGYSQNREPFLELAHRVPYRNLEKVAAGLAPGPARADAISEVLLATAGLLPPDRTDRPALRAAVRGKPMSSTRWHLFRVRPQNHPRRRILGFAHVLDLFLPPAYDGAEPWAGRGPGRGTAGLASRWPAAWEDGWWRPMERALMGQSAITDDESADHRSGPTGVPIGRNRARDMVVNCVLPFLHASARLNRDDRLAALSLEAYSRFPSLQDNELTREMLGHFFPNLDGGEKGRWKEICNARRQQGLLHLHRLMSSPRAARASVDFGEDSRSLALLDP